MLPDLFVVVAFHLDGVSPTGVGQPEVVAGAEVMTDPRDAAGMATAYQAGLAGPAGDADTVYLPMRLTPLTP